MKRIKLVVFIFINYCSAISQTPTVLWQKTYGGTMDDVGRSLFIEPNGDIVVAGFSESNNGDVLNHIGAPGSSDFWLIKLNSFGNIIWSYNYGGAESDQGYSVIKTYDNGFIICGETISDTISRYHAGQLGTDVLVTKIDSLGNFEWQKCYGGYYWDEGREIKQTSDSGCIFIAEIDNGGGDITGFHGVVDYWVVKINSNGIIQWNKCLGGTNFDTPHSITILSDGNILVTGVNSSSDGNVTCSPPNVPSAWVVKLDESGNILWDRCYGGSASDVGFDITESSGGGFYLSASSESNDGDVLGHIAGKDIWILKADSSGDIIWSNCFGGLGDENPESISKTSDEGIIVTGRTTSNFSNPSYYDVIVIKADSLGDLQWQTYLGGSNWDHGYDAVETPDHNYVVAGFTESSDGDITLNHGGQDAWVVKLEAPVSVDQLKDFRAFSYSVSELRLKLFFNLIHNTNIEVAFYDLTGRQVFSSVKKCHYEKNEIEIPFNLISGIYIAEIKTMNENLVFKFFVN